MDKIKEKNYSAFKINLSEENQDIQRTSFKYKEVLSLQNNFLRVYQTRRRHLTVGPWNLEGRQLNWNHVHRAL